jgi:hypothetical protein
MIEKLTKAQERVKTALACLIKEKHPVARAVEPLREAAVERAAEYAREQVAAVRKELKAAGNDLNVCAPYPRSGSLSRNDWLHAHRKYTLFGALCKWRKSTISMNEPRLADVDPELVKRFIDEAKKDAAWEYDAFIVKLCRKVNEYGPCKRAKVADDNTNVWGRSYLYVTLATGEEQAWLTQQIINVSKLGRPFNQWPTRLMKNHYVPA